MRSKRIHDDSRVQRRRWVGRTSSLIAILTLVIGLLAIGPARAQDGDPTTAAGDDEAAADTETVEVPVAPLDETPSSSDTTPTESTSTTIDGAEPGSDVIASDDESTDPSQTTLPDSTTSTTDPAAADPGTADSTSTDEPASADDVLPDDTTLDDTFGDTGDGGADELTEKVEPLPGFTGGGVVRGDNPIRALGSGAFEQPVLVIGRNAAQELRAGILVAERELGALNAELATLEADRAQFESDQTDRTNAASQADEARFASEQAQRVEDQARIDAEMAEATRLRAVEIAARVAAWQVAFSDAADNMRTAATGIGPGRVELARLDDVLASDEKAVLDAETLISIVQGRFDSATLDLDSAAADRENTLERRREAMDAEAAAQARLRTSTATREAAGTDLAARASELSREQRALRKVAIAFYIGSEDLEQQGLELNEGTNAVDRREIGRVGARTVFDLRTDDVIASRALVDGAQAQFDKTSLKESEDQAVHRDATAAVSKAENDVRAALRAESQATSDLTAQAEALDLARDQRTQRKVTAGRTRGAQRQAAEQLEAAERGLETAEAAATAAAAEIVRLDASKQSAVTEQLSEAVLAATQLFEAEDTAADETPPTTTTAPAATTTPSTEAPSRTTGSPASASIAGVTTLPEDRDLADANDPQDRDGAEDRTSQAETEGADLAEREAAAERTAELLRAEAAALDRRASLAPAALRSLLGSTSLTFPIAGEWNFIDSWGFPRSGGRLHKGADVFAPRGTPLVAIEDGRVRSSTNTLGGLVVYLTGESGNQYYYAHLEAVHPRARAGGSVRAGDVVGYVGTSGNAAGTPPHLHIGVKAPSTAAINPYPLLRALSEAVRAEQQRGTRASVPDRMLISLPASTIAQLVAEGRTISPQVAAQLPEATRQTLIDRGVLTSATP